MINHQSQITKGDNYGWKTGVCYRCVGSGLYGTGTCYVCDGTGKLDYPKSPDECIADLRAQLAAVTTERDEAQRALLKLGLETERTLKALSGERDALKAALLEVQKIAACRDVVASWPLLIDSVEEIDFIAHNALKVARHE